MSSDPKTVFMTAVEASGDLLGAELIDEVGRRTSGVRFIGLGGPQMAARGVRSDIDISAMQTLGIWDGLMNMRRATALAREVALEAAEQGPDMAVLIDSWGFSLRVAMALRETTPDTSIVKYIGPQVWASRPSRARQLARYVDHMLCIFPFETPYYEPLGLPCTVVGYPPLSRTQTGDGRAFRERRGLGSDEPVLLVLFGSRPKEITRIADAFEGAIAALVDERPELTVVVVTASSVADLIAQRARDWPFQALIVDETDKVDAFAAATVALAVSGTVTTEVAMQETPVVVGYRTDWLTWAIARSGFLQTKYITLLNVMAGSDIAPEFIQTRCTSRHLSAAVGRLLDDPVARTAQVVAQNQALDAMGRGLPPPAALAADAILERLGV